MARWLVKEEPSHYSFSDLSRDRETSWTGIHNPLALRHLRSMRPGDEGVYYHTGNEKSIVGRIRILTVPEPDPADDRGSWKVTISADGPLPRAVALAELKRDDRFASFDLVRNSRLSVLPIPDRVWSAILGLASQGVGSTAPRRSPATGGGSSKGGTRPGSSGGARRRPRRPRATAGAR